MKVILGSIFELQAELAGGKSGAVEFKGLLNEPVSFKTKYNLQKLLKKVNSEIEDYRKAVVDLYKENGAEEQDGNFVLGTTTGTKIGTATSQKLAFWNATPIVQPTTAVTGAILNNSHHSLAQVG